MITEPVQVAIAILHQKNQFLMQLRDNTPGIVYPGHWGFFGGHIEPGELPETAMKRELKEEINYVPTAIAKFRCYTDPGVIRHVYYAPLTVAMEVLELNEGWDMELLNETDVRRGDRYSKRAQQVRPLGKPHQQILLDFFSAKLLINSTI